MEPGLETGAWWRLGINQDVRSRFRERESERDDLRIDVLELLATTIDAYVFTVESEIKPEYARDVILMRGDISSNVTWVNKCRGGEEPRAGVLVRVLGCFEMGSGWCFDALRMKGVDNTIADSSAHDGHPN